MGMFDAALAQVVPDGGTTTKVRASSSGRFTVGIAPSNTNGISHNTYSAFSVSRPGVGLDNRGIDARTIVNEVTSSARSVLGGPVEVLGSRAHVVIANPNGITVNGTRFINTGGVALSGGKVRYEAGANGSTNIILAPGNGKLSVEGQGLSGTMTTLQLAAGKLRIDGAVANGLGSPSADIALTGPGNEVVLDASVSPLASLKPLAKRRAAAASPSNGFVVDVTPRGSLSASRISVAVNARGAGVSYAGGGQASLGDFTISANGKIRGSGAVIRAEKNVAITGGAIAIGNDRGRQSEVTALTKAVTLTATAGDLTIEGQVTGAERSEDDLSSKGGVTLASVRDIRLRSESAERLAIAFASNDDLVVEAGRNLINDTGRLLSNANTTVTAGNTIRNNTDGLTTKGLPSSVQIQTVRRRMPGLFGLFGLRRRITTLTVNTGLSRIPDQQAFIAGATVDIVAKRIENSGEIDALDGSLSIVTDTLINRASRQGDFRLVKRCGFTCTTRAEGGVTLASARINAAGSATIVATDAVENDGGDIVAFGNLEITSPRITGSAVAVPGASLRPAALDNFFAGPTARFTLTPTGGTFQAPAGTLTLTTDTPVLLEGGLAEGQIATIVPAGLDLRTFAQPSFVSVLKHAGLLRLWLE